jgi:hypothetical protein
MSDYFLQITMKKGRKKRKVLTHFGPLERAKIND